MKNIKTFENFQESQKVYDMGELYHIEKWIESVWERLEKTGEQTFEDFFNEIEETCGENVVEIIDGLYNAYKLHYYQSGRTVTTGGIDTGDFIRNFEDYKSTVENILTKYIEIDSYN